MSAYDQCASIPEYNCHTNGKESDGKWYCYGNCECTVTGSYDCQCSSGNADCDLSTSNGCECTIPSNCCGGTGGNTRYHSCSDCVGTACSTCGATTCSQQNCLTASYCSTGSCIACPVGTGNCDQVASTGCEVNVNTDPVNCGSCGTVCPDTYGACGAPSCTGGTCGNTKYTANQYTGCTGAAGCTTDNKGELVCSCNGNGICADACGNGVCDLWETKATCAYDCNKAPSVTGVQASPNPVPESENIQLSASWTDDGDSVILHICKTATMSGTSSCAGGSWCDSTVTPTSPAACSYTSQSSDVGMKDFFAFICDNNAMKPRCSSAVQSQFSVNHRPVVTSASSDADALPGKKIGTPITFTMTFSDVDGDNARLHVCKTNAFASGACVGGSWCDSLTASATPKCSCMVYSQGYIVNDRFVFAEDEHGMASLASLQGVFYEDRPHQIAQFTAQQLHIYYNAMDDVLVRIFNNNTYEFVDITLAMDGPATFQAGSSRISPHISSGGKVAMFNNVPPKTEDMILVSVRSAGPDSSSYALTLTAQTAVVGFPETVRTENDVMSVFSVQPPSFPAMDWPSATALLIAAVALFASRRRE